MVHLIRLSKKNFNNFPQ